MQVYNVGRDILWGKLDTCVSENKNGNKCLTNVQNYEIIQIRTVVREHIFVLNVLSIGLFSKMKDDIIPSEETINTLQGRKMEAIS